MLPELQSIILNQQYVLVLLLVFCIISIYKNYNILGSVNPTPFKGKLIILLSGLLPVPGRIVLCKSLIDVMSGVSDKRTNLTAYISTHHYYFWSPLEKSVVILLGGLSITYVQFINHLLIPIIMYLGFMLYYICTLKLKIVSKHTENKVSGGFDILLLLLCLIISCFADVIIVSLSCYLMYLLIKYKPGWKFLKDVDVSTLVYVSIILIISCVVKHNIVYIHEYLNKVQGDLYLAMLLSFIFSFMLGSSSKFSGLCLLMTIIYGLDYMCIFYVIDFSGYMLSPTHKCTLVAQSGCKSGRGYFYSRLMCICASMVVCTGLYTWFVV